jgi:hypothetical protein
MSKLRMFAMIFVCGMCCLLSFNSLWAADYSVTVVNNLRTGDTAKDADTYCYPVTLTASSTPVKSVSLNNKLKVGDSGTLIISNAKDCNRLRIDVNCHWWRQTNPLMPGDWRDTNSTATWDCVGGTAEIVFDDNRGGIRVESPKY